MATEYYVVCMNGNNASHNILEERENVSLSTAHSWHVSHGSYNALPIEVDQNRWNMILLMLNGA